MWSLLIEDWNEPQEYETWFNTQDEPLIPTEQQHDTDIEMTEIQLEQSDSSNNNNNEQKHINGNVEEEIITKDENKIQQEPVNDSISINNNDSTKNIISHENYWRINLNQPKDNEFAIVIIHATGTWSNLDNFNTHLLNNHDICTKYVIYVYL